MRTELFVLAGLLIMVSCSSGSDSNPFLGSGGAGGDEGGEAGRNDDGTAGNRPGNNVGSGGSPGAEGASAAGSKGGSKDGGKAGGQASGGSKNAGGSTVVAGAKNAGGTKGTGGTKIPKDGGTKEGGTKDKDGSVGTGGSGEGEGGPVSVGCDREGLDAAVKAYLAALESKDTSKMPLSASVKYTEIASIKSTVSELGEGLWKTAQPIAYSRSLLDVTNCETFTEVFVTEGDHPYVLGTRLAVKDGKIAEIYTLDTDSDDWNFDATAYAACSESEDWSVLPEAARSTRDELIAAGQAYFDIFSDKSTVVPWGEPCYRLEGGKGCTPAMDKASKTCNVGIPDGITFTKTHWVVDEDIGAVVGITMFGGADPDTHLFRLVNGKIRYVHTLTIMK